MPSNRCEIIITLVILGDLFFTRMPGIPIGFQINRSILAEQSKIKIERALLQINSPLPLSINFKDIYLVP
jgi:hypothetical protein